MNPRQGGRAIEDDRCHVSGVPNRGNSSTRSNRALQRPKLAGARRCARRAPLSYQPACKPGSVGHRPLAQTIRDGHSSGTMFAHGLGQPTRTAGLTSPCGVIAFRELTALPSLFGFAPGVVCHAVSVAGYAVRSYRTFSPLLPPPLILPPQAGEGRVGEAVRSLWHFPWGCPRRTLSGTVCRWSPDFPPPQPFDHSGSGRPAD